MVKQNQSRTVSTRLPSQLYAEIQKLIQSGQFLNTSDILREAIRKLVETQGVN